MEMGHGDSEKCRDNITSDHTRSSRILGIFIASRKTSTLIGVIFSKLFMGSDEYTCMAYSALRKLWATEQARGFIDTQWSKFQARV